MRVNRDYRSMRQYPLVRAPVARTFSDLLGTKEAISGLPNLNLISLRLARQPHRLPRQADTQRPGRAHPMT